MVSLWSPSVAQVLVIGGTGTLGRRLTPFLVEQGHGVRVLSRQSAPVVPAGVLAHRGDVRTGEGLATALDGVETVIQSVAATRSAKATELDGMRTLLAARGDRHVIYVSIVGVDGNPFGYYRTKLEAERLLERSGGNAVVAARALDLTLTARNKGAAEEVPMAGVPHHAASGYVQKLLEKGFSVAICEQMADPSKVKGLVPRQVVRVVTPGIAYDDAGLDARQNHYLAAVERGAEGRRPRRARLVDG